jgi:hypothetical protein
MLLAFSQLQSGPLSWSIGVYASAIGIPIAVTVAMFSDLLLHIGRESFPYVRDGLGAELLANVLTLTLITSVGSLIYYLRPGAFWSFLGVSVVSYVLFQGWLVMLAGRMKQGPAPDSRG